MVRLTDARGEQSSGGVPAAWSSDWGTIGCGGAVGGIGMHSWARLHPLAGRGWRQCGQRWLELAVEAALRQGFGEVELWTGCGKARPCRRCKRRGDAVARPVVACGRRGVGGGRVVLGA